MTDEDITSDEAAAVFRRAAELDQRGSKQPGRGLDLAALEQAGVEAGLSAGSIRQALAEVRAGTLEPVARQDAVVSRTLRGDRIEHEVERFMHRQRFRVARRLDDRTVWEADRSLAAGLAKAMDFNKRIVLREITQLTTCVVPVPGTDLSHVRFELDMGRARWGWYSLPMVAGGLGVGAVVALAVAGIEPAAIAAAPGRRRRRRWRLRRRPGRLPRQLAPQYQRHRALPRPPRTREIVAMGGLEAIDPRFTSIYERALAVLGEDGPCGFDRPHRVGRRPDRRRVE